MEHGEFLTKNCCTCLKGDSNLQKVTKNDESNLSVLVKLQTCVSEIQWKENYVICTPCNADLNSFYVFREKCILSEIQRNEKLVAIESCKTEHAETETNEPCDVYTCEHCGKAFAIKKELIHHFEEHTETQACLGRKAKTYLCERCNKVFPYRKKLIQHSVQAHNMDPKQVKTFICHLCNNKFLTSSYLNQHLVYHQSDRNCVCPTCGKGYKTSSDLRVHEKIHSNKKEYKCDQCPKSFNTHKNLGTHKKVVHTDPSKWTHACGICSKRFPIKSNFITHMRRHNNERPFSCHLCSKAFADNGTLKKHLEAHTNCGNYDCDLCEKKYKNKKVLAIHRKRLHGVGDAVVPTRTKKHLCHLCPKAFFEINKLNRHLRTHTGEKPFSCYICEKNFHDSTYVKQHLKKVHEVDYHE